jgi:hypothetical protein
VGDENPYPSAIPPVIANKFLRNIDQIFNMNNFSSRTFKSIPQFLIKSTFKSIPQFLIKSTFKSIPQFLIKSGQTLLSAKSGVLSYRGHTLHALISQTNMIICPKNTCKPFQNHAKYAQGIPLRGNEVSDAFNHTRIGVFMKNIRKCTKEISHDLGCRSAV